MTEKEALEMKLNIDDFTFVDIYKLNRSDQLMGKNSKYILDVCKRFFKNPWVVIFFLLLIIVILLTIMVPALSPYSAFTSVSTNSWANNLRPRIPGLGIHGHYETVLTDGQYNLMSKVPGFIVGNAQQIYGEWYVMVNPYALPELQNIYPIFGTDASGVDVWTRTWYATQQSLLIALIVALSSIVIGAIYGSISGSFAGRMPDTIMMRIVEILSGVPTILWLLILATIFSFGNSGGVDNTSLTISLILITWMGPAILTRTFIMKNKDAEYVQATRTIGGNQARIIFKHMLPNISGRLIVRFVHLIPAVIFFEATLVFLNIKSPFDIGLGTLINQGYQASEQIYLLIAPTLVLVAITLSAQIVANGINDAIDPRIS
ncbi:MAG: ABC transporter permease [Malacoplasma sp.]